jgi:signal peptidase II
LSSTRSGAIGRWLLLAGVVAVLLVVDQTSKWLVRQSLAVNESWAPIPALAKIFTVTHVQNTGVAFGQFPGGGWLFMAVNLIVLIGVLIYYPRIPADQRLMRLACILILAGDLGNVIDRIRTMLLLVDTTGSIWAALPFASVTDFMDFHIWPVWNVADLCLVSGICIVAFLLLKQEREKEKLNAEG